MFMADFSGSHWVPLGPILGPRAAFLRGGDFEERKARGETPKGLQYSRAFGGKDHWLGLGTNEK